VEHYLELAGKKALQDGPFAYDYTTQIAVFD
jgi:hypothetical protein